MPIIAAKDLVKTYRVFQKKPGLGGALVSEWPSYAAYVISFSTIVVIWVNHHAVTDTLEREGVQKFSDSFDELLTALHAKQESLTSTESVPAR